MVRQFQDRTEAGQLLAEQLRSYANCPDVLVLGLPRGGVPVAYEVARALNAPLDILLVRKLGVPGHEELAMGAIASGGIEVLNDEVVAELHIPRRVINAVAQREQRELERRERLYREARSAHDPCGRTVILVDDGLATGTTMQAAVHAARAQGAAKVVVAVSVVARESCLALAASADAVVAVMTPDPFYAVGFWYEDFTPTSDAEVTALLACANQRLPLNRPNQAQQVGQARRAVRRRRARVRRAWP